MRLAIHKANELNVPLIVCGDLHNTKALLRGECVNAMIETFKLCKIKPYVMIGNHDKINEKSTEHSLNFLSPYVSIIDTPRYIPGTSEPHLYAIPYMGSASDARGFLNAISIRGNRTLFLMHQGVNGSYAGEYLQDKSAISRDDIGSRRIISGHYHRRQDIQGDDNGKFSYIGNPYTINFAEAEDPEKGFQILDEEGNLTFVPTNLRKHVVAETKANLTQISKIKINPGDLLRLRITDTKELLSTLSRKSISEALGTDEFKLEFIPTDLKIVTTTERLTDGNLLDSIIDGSNISDQQKLRIKNLWKNYESN